MIIRAEQSTTAETWAILSIKYIFHWSSNHTTFLISKIHPWFLTIKWNVGCLRTTSTLWRGKSLLNIRNRLVIQWLRGLWIFKAQRLWLNCWLKYLILRSTSLSRKKMWLVRMEMFWPLEEVEQARLLVQYWGYFQLKCYLKLGCLCIKKNSKIQSKMLDADLQILTKPSGCTAFSSLLHQF